LNLISQNNSFRQREALHDTIRCLVAFFHSDAEGFPYDLREVSSS
jgi:hypothetical protein